MSFPTDKIGHPQFPATVPSVRIVGLDALAAGVAEYLAAVGVTARVSAVSWRARAEHLNQGPGGANRIVFFPGKEPTGGAGAAGSFSRKAPTRDGSRPIAAWEKLVTMSVWGADITAANDESAQLRATETLLERAMEAVEYARDPVTGTPVGVGNIVWGDGRWSKPNTNAAFGQELLVEFTQLITIRAQTPDIARPQPVFVQE